MVLTFKSMDKVLNCDNVYENYVVTIYFGSIYMAFEDDANFLWRSGEHTFKIYFSIFLSVRLIYQ